MYRKSYIPILLTTAILCSPLQADGWTPAWLLALWNKYQNYEYQKLQESQEKLEKDPRYKELKQQFPESVPLIVMPTKEAEKLSMLTTRPDWEDDERLKNELRMREFLDEHNITQFNETARYIIYEKDGDLRYGIKKHETQAVGWKDSYLKTINEAQLIELVIILTETGMSYKNDLSVDLATGKLDLGLWMSDSDFPHTNKLTAFEQFYFETQKSTKLVKLDEAHKKDPKNNPAPYSFFDRADIITDEGKQWLENYYHTLQKECRNSDGSLNKKCTIVPLPKRADLER